jgi:secondary thiamine-phosphate synthase enzyme
MIQLGPLQRWWLCYTLWPDGAMPMISVDVHTARRTELIDITTTVAQALTHSGLMEGLCQVFVPHTTAAVTINENADPSVQRDILHIVDGLIPFADPGYRHGEGNSAAHIKTMLVGSSESIPVSDGRLQLGTWQGVFFCEFDGPRTRQVWIQTLGA